MKNDLMFDVAVIGGGLQGVKQLPLQLEWEFLLVCSLIKLKL